MDCFVGIDLGTTGVKCVLYDENLCALEQAYTEYPLITLPNGGVEQDAELWWSLTCRMLRDILTARDPASVRSVGISSQGISIVPVDAAFRPQCRAISWLDRRSGLEGNALLERVGAGNYAAITGRLSPAMYAAPKIEWFARSGIQASRYLMPLDFVTARLCGRPVTDHSMAAGTGAYDMRRRHWSDEILDALDIEARLLPEIRDSGTLAGSVTPEAARLTGLREGTLVAVGAQDQKCGALAAGLGPGIATLSMGTAFTLTMEAGDAPGTRDGFIPVFSGIFGDGYQLESCIGTGGAALRWWRDHLGEGAGYGDLNQMADTYAPDTDTPYFFPHLSGRTHPYPHPEARACFWGISLDTKKTALLYSVMEGLCFSILRNIEAAGRTVDCIRAFGGGSNSDVWLQMVADVCRRPVCSLATAETASMGAAMLAMIAHGMRRAECLEIADKGCLVRKWFAPREQSAALLRRRYEAFCALEDRLFAR